MGSSRQGRRSKSAWRAQPEQAGGAVGSGASGALGAAKPGKPGPVEFFIGDLGDECSDDIGGLDFLGSVDEHSVGTLLVAAAPRAGGAGSSPGLSGMCTILFTRAILVILQLCVNVLFFVGLAIFRVGVGVGECLAMTAVGACDVDCGIFLGLDPDSALGDGDNLAASCAGMFAGDDDGHYEASSGGILVSCSGRAAAVSFTIFSESCSDNLAASCAGIFCCPDEPWHPMAKGEPKKKKAERAWSVSASSSEPGDQLCCGPVTNVGVS